MALTLFLILCTMSVIGKVLSLWILLEDQQIKGYKSLIPIANLYYLLKAAEHQWYEIFGYFIPGLNLYFFHKLNCTLSKKYKMQNSFTWGLTLLAPVFYPLLAIEVIKKDESQKIPVWHGPKIIEQDSSSENLSKINAA